MKTAYVNKHLADPMQFGNLRGPLTILYETDRYKTIEDDKLENNSIYILDGSQFTNIQNYLPDNLFDEMKLLGDFHIQVINDFSSDVKAISKAIYSLYRKGFNVENIWIQVSFNYEKDELNKLLTMLGIFGVNIFCYNVYLHQTYRRYLQDSDLIESFKKVQVENQKKFTIFTRRFSDDRFVLFCDLLDRGILKSCEYTFTNLSPEQVEYPHVWITKDELKKRIPDFITKKGNVSQWIDNMPYHIGSLMDPWYNELYSMFNLGKLNVVIETRPTNISNLTLTEKTYKPIIMCKPFVIYGASGNLDILRKEGFKTFDTIIDESYDCVEDDEIIKRKAIVKLLEKLNSLTDAEFFNLMNSDEMNRITNFNFKHFIKIASRNYTTSKSVYYDLFGVEI